MKKQNIVGEVRLTQAIDFTKIYYIKITKALRVGSVIKIDSESITAELVENKNK